MTSARYEERPAGIPIKSRISFRREASMNHSDYVGSRAPESEFALLLRQRRRGRRPGWARTAYGGCVAITALAVVVSGCSTDPSRPVAPASAASSAPSRAAQSASLAPPPAPRPNLTASELHALLANTPTLPNPYKPYGKIITFQGSGQDLPPARLGCADVARIFGDLAAENVNYSADAEVYALDTAGDELRVEVLEAASPVAAARDLAALRAGSQACPVINTSFEGAFHATVASLPGGSKNLDLRMAQSPSDNVAVRPYGPQDMLVVQDGSYLVDVTYSLQSRPGRSRQPGLPLSVQPPSTRIAESILHGL
jgi:hypothetical protein